MKLLDTVEMLERLARVLAVSVKGLKADSTSEFERGMHSGFLISLDAVMSELEFVRSMRGDDSEEVADHPA